MPDLRDALIGYADWQGYRHAERADAWLARLEMTRPEIDFFRAQSVPDDPPYLPVPVAVAAPDGAAAEWPDRPSGSAEDRASAALARARDHASLAAFTWLPDAVPEARQGWLAGLPVAVKDLMHVAGFPLSGGSAAFERVRSNHDAEVVARLRRAGAAFMGFANLHEFAYGITSDNPHFGRVVNPVAPGRIPGGSSGGSAAAIAAGIVTAALGTDTAGSIRIPAACCGIAGFKPSYDALPRSGVLDLATSLDHVGPMGRSVADCAALFAAMLDLPALPPWNYRDLAGRTVCRLRGYFDEPLDPEVRAAVDEAMAAAAADGAACIEGEVEGAGAAPAIQLMTIAPEAGAVHAERVRSRGHLLGEDVRVRIEAGQFIPGYWYTKAQRLRRRFADAVDAAFGNADVLVCATLRTPAPAVGAGRVAIGGEDHPLHTAVTQLTMPFNLSGLPAISIPWTMSAAGVPIAIQVAGRRGSDWRTLAIARRLEAASPWSRRGAR
ncbi:MAG: amidase [Betaproteobacteria bacterium]|nr:amidase [Betaproteobacteria bacterium]